MRLNGSGCYFFLQRAQLLCFDCYRVRWLCRSIWARRAETKTNFDSWVSILSEKVPFVRAKIMFEGWIWRKYQFSWFVECCTAQPWHRESSCAEWFLCR